MNARRLEASITGGQWEVMKNHLAPKVKRLQAALSPFIKRSPIRNQSEDNTHRHGPVNRVHGNSGQRGEEWSGEKKRGGERREQEGKVRERRSGEERSEREREEKRNETWKIAERECERRVEKWREGGGKEKGMKGGAEVLRRDTGKEAGRTGRRTQRRKRNGSKEKTILTLFHPRQQPLGGVESQHARRQLDCILLSSRFSEMKYFLSPQFLGGFSR